MGLSNDRFTAVLDQSLERVLARGVSVEECLAVYPEHAEELRPLLLAAVATRRAVAWQPSSAKKDAARQQMLTAVALRARGLRAASTATAPAWPRGWWRGLLAAAPRWALAPALAVLFAGVLGFGTVAASQNSMPDSVLYPVKRVAERVRMAVVLTDNGRSDLYLSLADRRANEVVYLAQTGKVDEAGKISQDFQSTITQFKVFADGRRAELQSDRLAQSQQGLMRSQQETTTALLSAAEAAPENVRTQIRTLVDTLNQGFTSALQSN